METAYDFFHHLNVCVSELIQSILLSIYHRPKIFLDMGIDGSLDTLGPALTTSCS